jgi:hypothetical protein
LCSRGVRNWNKFLFLLCWIFDCFSKVPEIPGDFSKIQKYAGLPAVEHHYHSPTGCPGAHYQNEPNWIWRVCVIDENSGSPHIRKGLPKAILRSRLSVFFTHLSAS